MAIQVTLEDHTGNFAHQAKIVENVPVQRLIPAIVTAMGLPVTDPAGRPITYHLSHNNRRLQEDETLESAGVQSGDTLTIVPEMTAGQNAPVPSALRPTSPLVTLGPVVREKRPVQGFPGAINATHQGSIVQVHITAGVMRAIQEHAAARRDREVGGILLGEVYEDAGRFLVSVEESLPALYTPAGPAFLAFTARTWLDILARRNTRPEAKTVGWYHSHPGWGVFLSGDDRFSHCSFFGRQPWYVALVTDPLTGEFGVFAWENGEVRRCPETVIV